MEYINDKEKMEYLKSLSERAKLEFIYNLQSDEEKIALLDIIIRPRHKADIIATLKSEDSKMQCLNQIEDDYSKFKIIRSLKSDDKKIEALNSIENEDFKFKIISSLIDDSKRVEFLDSIENENYKIQIILGLQDDDKKIAFLDKIENDINRAKIINSLQSDDKKIELLDTIENDNYKAQIIAAFQDDDKKIEYINRFEDSLNKTEIILSLSKDDEKLSFLNEVDDYNKIRILSSIQDQNKINEHVTDIKNEFLRAQFLAREVKADEVKISSITDFKEDNNIALVQMSLNDRQKLKEIFLDENRKYSSIGLDRKMTIGMEIESEGINSTPIRRMEEILGSWQTKEDGSLENGAEVISPILTDNKEDIENVYMVCEMLKRSGQEATERCGGHVHIGADYLQSKEAYVNLLEIWGNTEQIMYKICNQAGNTPRESGVTEYAQPISNEISEAINSGVINLKDEEELDDFIDSIQEVQGSRYSGLNLLNINNGKNTIEFRLSNGTINPDTWIENARLFGRIVQRSQELAEIEKQPTQSEEDKKLLSMKEQLKGEIPEQEKMELLLELLLDENEREVYRDRYNSNSKLLEGNNILEETKFSRVDFKKKKHSLGEFYDVAVNDRSESTNEVTRETTHGIRTENELEHTGKNLEEK